MSPCCVPTSQIMRTGPNAQQTRSSEQVQVRRTCPQRCLKTLERTAGEWFCPRCKSELDLDSSNEPMHSSLVPTRLMKQEDCYRSLAAALGMPPAQSPSCHMLRPVCHLQSQSAEHTCTALSCESCTSFRSNCISCAVLCCNVA